MTLEDLKKLKILIAREDHIKSPHFHNYSFHTSWGISTSGIDKAFIISISKGDQLYEKYCLSFIYRCDLSN